MWNDIPQSIAKKNQLDYFNVSLKRKDVNYTVTYLMGKYQGSFSEPDLFLRKRGDIFKKSAIIE